MKLLDKWKLSFDLRIEILFSYKYFAQFCENKNQLQFGSDSNKLASTKKLKIISPCVSSDFTKLEEGYMESTRLNSDVQRNTEPIFMIIFYEFF